MDKMHYLSKWVLIIIFDYLENPYEIVFGRKMVTTDACSRNSNRHAFDENSNLLPNSKVDSHNDPHNVANTDINSASSLPSFI